jgi:ubiquinone/menaquinone biosynthesis C-methylase UbiE
MAHPIFARLYARYGSAAEKAGAAAHRDELLADLKGRVIEVGAGSGLCFSHYPASATVVVAVEPQPNLRQLAEQAAHSAPVPVRVVEGTAERLPAEDGSFDAAVLSLVLCSVPSQHCALAEVCRVLRAGGQLRFYEHVRSEEPRRARLQDRVDWIWPHLLGGCHANRVTGAAIADAGFRIEHCRRFEFRPCALSAPVAPHIIGEAIRQ